MVAAAEHYTEEAVWTTFERFLERIESLGRKLEDAAPKGTILPLSLAEC